MTVEMFFSCTSSSQWPQMATEHLKQQDKLLIFSLTCININLSDIRKYKINLSVNSCVWPVAAALVGANTNS